MTDHPTKTDGEWRVMRFEDAGGSYAEFASNQVGPEAITLPPGYRFVRSTPMVPAAERNQLHQALADLHAAFAEVHPESQSRRVRAMERAKLALLASAPRPLAERVEEEQ